MPIKQVFDTQDAVPEFLRAVVTEQDGKFVFEAETAAEVGNLKATLKKEREGRTKFEPLAKKAEKFKALLDAEDDEVEQFLESWQKRGEQADKPDANSQAVRDAVEHALKKEREKFGKTETELKQQIEELTTQNRDFAIWTPVQKAAAEGKVLPDRLASLVTILKANKRFDLDESGKLVFNDAEGYPTGLTVEKAFTGPLKEEFAWAFAASGNGGSGADPSQKSRQGNSTDLSKLSPTERLKALRRQEART